MTDMIVKLYELPELAPCLDKIAANGVTIRRAMPYEKSQVLDWVLGFQASWVDECDVGFSQIPHKCFIATDDGRVVGFGVYDVVVKNMFGPTGVDESQRGKGIGTVLLLACLHAMRNDGYAYATIGGIGPREYYEKVVGATVIEGSTPGIYIGRLNKD